MEPVSRTPEGESNTCLVCGHYVVVEPTRPPGDAPCPGCGTLMWFDRAADDVVSKLANRGAFVTTDEDGEVVSIRFCGTAYNDLATLQMAGLTGVHTIDIRDTKITPAGAMRLRKLLPSTTILHER